MAGKEKGKMGEEEEKEEETPATFVPRICADGDVFHAFQDFRILNQLTDGFTVASHQPGNRRIIWANDAACKFMMRAPLEVLQKIDLEQGASPGMLKFGQMVYETVQVKKERYHFPKTVYFGGKPTNINIQSHPIRVRMPGEEQDQVFVLDKIMWEDTRQTEMEENARAQRLSFELLTNVDCNILSFHKEREECVYQNHFAKTFYGQRLPEDCHMTNWLDLLQFEDPAKRTELVKQMQALEIRSPPLKFECFVDRKAVAGASAGDYDAEGRVWHRVLVRAIYDPNTGDTCYMVQEHLVTALKEAQMDVMRAQQERELFFVSISHDLRSPLNGLVGLTSSLLMDPKMSSSQRNTLRVIMNSGERLVGLVNDILDAGAIASGALTIKEELVDLRTIAREVVEVSRTLVKKGVRLVCGVDDSLPPLLGDGGRVNQILTNLVANSLKYTAHGSIRIAARYEEAKERVRVEVVDTGIGIPQDKLAHVWEPFQQVDTETTKRYGGTGLGLSLVKSLVEAHGGDYGVDSRFGVPDSGSQFWFTIPAAKGEQCEDEEDGAVRRVEEGWSARSSQTGDEGGSLRSRSMSPGGSWKRQRSPLEAGRGGVMLELSQQLEMEKQARVAAEGERDALADKVSRLAEELAGMAQRLERQKGELQALEARLSESGAQAEGRKAPAEEGGRAARPQEMVYWKAQDKTTSREGEKGSAERGSPPRPRPRPSKAEEDAGAGISRGSASEEGAMEVTGGAGEREQETGGETAGGLGEAAGPSAERAGRVEGEGARARAGGWGSAGGGGECGVATARAMQRLLEHEQLARQYSEARERVTLQFSQQREETAVACLRHCASLLTNTGPAQARRSPARASEGGSVRLRYGDAAAAPCPQDPAPRTPPGASAGAAGSLRLNSGAGSPMGPPRTVTDLEVVSPADVWSRRPHIVSDGARVVW